MNIATTNSTMAGRRAPSAATTDDLNCSDCNTIMGSADYVIKCDHCSSSFHHDCVGYTQSSFNAFSKLHSANLALFHCAPCKVKIAGILAPVPSEDQLPISADARLAKVETQLESITKALGITASAPAVPGLPVEPPSSPAVSYAGIASRGLSSHSRVVTVSDLHKVQEDDCHRRSIVIAGLPECGKDIDDVARLCRHLDPSATVTQTFRMGRVPYSSARPAGPVRPRLLKVHLPSSSVAKSLLSEARKLKDSSEFRGVFIRRSMSVDERKRLAEIRNRCKQLNDANESEGIKYVVINERLVRFKGCTLQPDGRSVGGTRDIGWSDTIDTASNPCMPGSVISNPLNQ